MLNFKIMMIENLTKPENIDFVMHLALETKEIAPVDKFILKMRNGEELGAEPFVFYFWTATNEQKQILADLKIKSLKLIPNVLDQGHLVAYCFLNKIDLTIFKNKIDQKISIDINLLEPGKDPGLFDQLRIMMNTIASDKKQSNSILDLKAQIMQMIRLINKEQNLSLNTNGYLGVKELQALINLYENRIAERLIEK